MVVSKVYKHYLFVKTKKDLYKMLNNIVVRRWSDDEIEFKYKTMVNEMHKRNMNEMVKDMFSTIESQPKISPYALQRKLGTNYESIQNYLELIEMIQSKPQLVIEGAKNKKIFLVEDWMDPFIREQVGHTPNPADMLYIKLLDMNSTSEETAAPINEFEKAELDALRDAAQREHMIVTKDLRAYLSEVGLPVARGVKKLFNL